MPNREMYKRHLAELRSALADHETVTNRLRALIAGYEELTGEHPPIVAEPPTAVTDSSALQQSEPDPVVDPTPDTANAGVRRPLVPATVFRSVTREIMRGVGRPMQRDEINDHLALRGIVFGGKEPLSAVATQLYRAREEFRRVPGQGYWFTDEPLPGEATHDTIASEPDDEDSSTDEEQAIKTNGTAADGSAAMAMFR